MRKIGFLRRYMLILGAMGILYSCALSSCIPVLVGVLGDDLAANLMRSVASDLNDQAYEADGEPQTVGQFFDSLLDDVGFEDDKNDRDNEFDDWWDDIWD
jgi:hypothetical protein